MRDPEVIDVAPRNSTAERVEHHVHHVDQDHKRALLVHLLHYGNWGQTLVFARTKHGADRLAEQLYRDGVLATAIHGDKSQGARTKALTQFKQRKVHVLVATDVAARGIDVEGLSHVVNFDMPNAAEDYIHRIGRTGRAGASGRAVSLVSGDEREQLQDIQRLLGRTLAASVVEGFEPRARPEPWQTRAPRETVGLTASRRDKSTTMPIVGITAARDGHRASNLGARRARFSRSQCDTDRLRQIWKPLLLKEPRMRLDPPARHRDHLTGNPCRGIGC